MEETEAACAAALSTALDGLSLSRAAVIVTLAGVVGILDLTAVLLAGPEVAAVLLADPGVD